MNAISIQNAAAAAPRPAEMPQKGFRIPVISWISDLYWNWQEKRFRKAAMECWGCLKDNPAFAAGGVKIIRDIRDGVDADD